MADWRKAIGLASVVQHHVSHRCCGSEDIDRIKLKFAVWHGE
jgi:hypothetical protein